jgi:hypothetical protein
LYFIKSTSLEFTTDWKKIFTKHMW